MHHSRRKQLVKPVSWRNSMWMWKRTHARTHAHTHTRTRQHTSAHTQQSCLDCRQGHLHLNNAWLNYVALSSTVTSFSLRVVVNTGREIQWERKGDVSRAREREKMNAATTTFTKMAVFPSCAPSSNVGDHQTIRV